MSLSLAARRARLVALRDLIDAEGGGALHAFAAPQPPMGGASETAPLVIAALGPVSFELHATEASMQFVDIEVHVALSGVPAWVRFVNGAGVAVMDLLAGLPGSGAPVIITDGADPPSLQLRTGGVAKFSCSMIEPA